MFVAGFVGAMNVFDAAVEPGAVELADGTRVPCDQLTGFGEGTWQVGIRPEDVQVSVDGEGADATVVREVPRGHYKELALQLGDQEVRSFVSPELPPHERVRVRFARAVVYRDDVLHRSETAAVAR
jgi:ABC-type sugar transport system ATPase subunit